jgi:hypothetical protein
MEAAAGVTYLLWMILLARVAKGLQMWYRVLGKDNRKDSLPFVK